MWSTIPSRFVADCSGLGSRLWGQLRFRTRRTPAPAPAPTPTPAPIGTIAFLATTVPEGSTVTVAVLQQRFPMTYDFVAEP